MELEHAIRVGAEVDRMLASEGWRLAVDSVEAELVSEWKIAKTKETREEIWSRYKNLDHIQTRLKALVMDGQMAVHKLREEERRAEATKKKGQV